MFGGKEIGNDFKVKPGVVSATRTVPDYISKPEYAYSGEPGESDPFAIRVYNKEEQEKARAAGRLARKMLDFANSLAIQPDKYSTEDVDRLTHEEIVKHGAYPPM